MYSFLVRHVFVKVRDLSRKRAVQCRKELEASQWWPREKILQLQQQRLLQLIEYAYANVPYYRKVFDEKNLKPADVASVADLVKLPVLTKQVIRENFDDLVSQSFPKEERLLSRTGGSTGEPLVFYSTRYELDRGYERSRRFFQWIGYRAGDKSVQLKEVHLPRSIWGRVRESSELFLGRTMKINAIEISVSKLPMIAKKLGNFQPRLITGYPASIYLLARFLQQEGTPHIRPRAIITVGEQLYDFQRELFHEVFSCDVYSKYVSFETNNIAAECTEHTGYHIASEDVIVEIVDDENRPVPLGEKGRILITNLHNYAMPFIRYSNGDIGAISDGTCPCGRGLPLLATLEGRVTDVISKRNGDSVPGIAIPWSFFISPDVEHFQIVQEDYDNISVRLVVNEDYPLKNRDELAQRIKTEYVPLFGEQMNIEVEFVDRIEPGSSGKRRMVISKVDPGGTLVPNQ